MFTEEELKNMGLPKEIIEKVLKEQKAKMDQFVEKSKYDNLNSELAQEKNKVSDRDKTIKELNGFKGTNDELNEKISKLQEELKNKDKEASENLKAEQKANAIKLGLMNFKRKPHDAEMIEKLIDKDKIILGDDGKISGLDEQLQSLAKEKSFLFVEEKTEKEEKNDKEDKNTFQKFFHSGQEPKDGKKSKQEEETSEDIGKAFAANKLQMLGIQQEDNK